MQCSSGFTEHNDSNTRTCRREDTSAGCGSLMMDVPYQYSRVCGRVRAYQVGSTDAFKGMSFASIHSNYVNGVSLNHGIPSTHIWTFVSALYESDAAFYASVCPCNDARAPSPPAFVGNDYFCESGNPLLPPPNPHFFLLTRCGMGMVVGIRAPAAHSTILHGSTSSSHSQPLTTLR